MLDHSLSVKKRTVQSDTVRHYIAKLFGLIVEQWNDCLLEFIIKRSCVFDIITSGFRFMGIVPNRPSRLALNASLNPPAIQDAERRDTIQCCLHATRARGLHWRKRSVNPNIDTRCDQLCQLNIVVLEVDNFDILLQSFYRLKYSLNQLLAALILWMSLARIEYLERPRFGANLL